MIPVPHAGLLWAPAITSKEIHAERDHPPLRGCPGARAGAGRITFAVAGLDVLLERLAARRIVHEPIETYSNRVRHVNVPDPDGNTIALAEPPNAESASPGSAGTGAFVIDD
jgi:catechol 2,3-dioxygenase-like lactoylglutathione lyase family enzyme